MAPAGLSFSFRISSLLIFVWVFLDGNCFNNFWMPSLCFFVFSVFLLPKLLRLAAKQIFCFNASIMERMRDQVHLINSKYSNDPLSVRKAGADPRVVQVIRSNPLKRNKRNYFYHTFSCAKRTC